ncbi:MAG TPA: ATP-binding protein [Gemmataceae bacterium]|nr:ATP-binding protein [Gemmataceae bacterium]
MPKDVTAKEKDYAYYIRRFASTIVAKNGDLKELLALAPAVPFDDRLCHTAELADLSLALIRAYLRTVSSRLYRTAERIPFAELCRQMAITGGPAEAPRPRNVGVLFFNSEPERFFPTARIKVVHFPQGVTGPIEEHTFSGPLDHQLRTALRHLQSAVVTERVTKVPDRAEAMRVFNYPYAALEEALVNAVYHRSYELREPIEVQVLPDQILVLSYPGPDRSVALADLQKERIVSRRYRNRRIGDFLKELDLTEGRCTGIPKMREAMAHNGSPPQQLITDEERTFFRLELPIHPAFLQVPVEGAVEDLVGDLVSLAADLNDTERRLLHALAGQPLAKADLVTALGYRTITGNVRKALDRLDGLGLIAFTVPAKPRSKSQKRRLTERGKKILATLHAREAAP